MAELRWDPCVSHRGDQDVKEFFDSYLSRSHANILLVVGTGFDPRSCVFAERFAGSCTRMSALVVNESRPQQPPVQADRAARNRQVLLDALPAQHEERVTVFESDLAVVGGRNAISMLSGRSFEDVTDVIVDMSALSVGISFPIVRYLLSRLDAGQGPRNLHAFVAHSPDADASIRPVPCDAPSYVHGFQGGATLSEKEDNTKLWMPRLASGRRAALERIHRFVAPHETCPILPFPARDPRQGDLLAIEYEAEFQGSWSVDARGIVYADEGDPLDLYRTILRLDDLRRPVFSEVGGSQLVLSPLGSKAMALGVLMAACERDLPVAHLESIEYEWVEEDIGTPTPIHVWLGGEVYPPRPRV